MMRYSLLIVTILVISGCAMLPSSRGFRSADQELRPFLDAIKQKQYRESYAFFSDDFKNKVSFDSHVGFMKLLHEELGEIKSCVFVKPNLIFFDETALRNGYANGSIINMYYKLDFSMENQPITVWLKVFRKNESIVIDSFEVLSDRLNNSEVFRDKVKTLGIKVQ